MSNFKNELHRLKLDIQENKESFLKKYDEYINEYNDLSKNVNKKIRFYFRLKNFSKEFSGFFSIFERLLKIDLYEDIFQKQKISNYCYYFYELEKVIKNDFEKFEKTEVLIQNFSRIDFNKLTIIKHYEYIKDKFEKYLDYFIEYIENVPDYWVKQHKIWENNNDKIILIEDDLSLYKHEDNLNFTKVEAGIGGDRVFSIQSFDKIPEKDQKIIRRRMMKYYPELFL